VHAQNPFGGNASEIDVGRGLFRILCAPCHGIHAKGGRGPDLTTGVYANGSNDRDLFRVVGSGVPGTEMPGFAARYGEDNVWRLIAYLRSATERQEAPPGGDRAAGERLFWGKGNCGTCHRVGPRGSAAGPDLSRIGRKRSLAYLRQSLLDPNADLTAGFYKITARPPNSGPITGVQRGYDNFSCQLMTLDGELRSFPRDETTRCDREFVSLMPSYRSWSPRELDDMLVFLLTLRGE
jgi:putative heme-binding domain-containing protein